MEKGIVLCYHAGQIDQAILAFATTKAESPIQQAIQIENMLRDRLADYMVPQVVLIERVPLLVNGKIDRQSLLKMYENTNNNNGKWLRVCGMSKKTKSNNTDFRRSTNIA